MDTSQAALLSIRDLKIRFRNHDSAPAVVNGLSLDIMPGESVALVGESGCGKSSTALAIMGLLPETARVDGSVLMCGDQLVRKPENLMRRLRGNSMGMIFQEPMTSLNPVHRIGTQITEVLHAHSSLTSAQARERALELLHRVGFADPKAKIDVYPHQLSGGQRQRVVIAIAIACEPHLLIADEPTTALDATIQKQIMDLLDGLRRDFSMGLLLITHDLSVVSRWTDRVVVMHHGEEMEELASNRLFRDAAHPYTRGLIGASVDLDEETHYRRRRLAEIRTVSQSDGQYSFVLGTPEPLELATPDSKAEPILKVQNVVAEYGAVRAVNDVSISIATGETVGLVGESGSGKSTLAKTIMGLVQPRSGVISFRGTNIVHTRAGAPDSPRRHIQMIFQDPFGSLNPRQTVETVLNNVLVVHGVKSSAERRGRILSMLDKVGLPSNSRDRFPHEFSGGQRQRIGIARALILEPALVICDEPVSALDVSIQAQILNQLTELKASMNLSYLFVSHDLSVVQYISDRVIVMKDARIVEENDRLGIWKNPQHPYTRTLIEAAGGHRPAVPANEPSYSLEALKAAGKHHEEAS